MTTLVWGVYDTVDDCWLGTNDAGTGPRAFDDHALAVALENVLRVRFDYPVGRLSVLPYHGDASTPKDELTPARTGAEALAILGWDELLSDAANLRAAVAGERAVA